MPHALLAPLRDVDGVYGSLLVSSEGDLVADDLPSWMAGASLVAATGRIARLRETLAPEGPLDWCAIRYAEHKLFLKSAGELTFTVVGRADTDATALRMAITLASRRLPSLEVEVEVELAAEPELEPTLTPALPPPPPVPSPPRRPSSSPFGASTSRARTYRGRRIDD